MNVSCSSSSMESTEINVSPFLPDESISYIQIYTKQAWPTSSTRKCFHCAESIPSIPVPAVENYKQNQYHVFPYHFCLSLIHI